MNHFAVSSLYKFAITRAVETSLPTRSLKKTKTHRNKENKLSLSRQAVRDIFHPTHEATKENSRRASKQLVKFLDLQQFSRMLKDRTFELRPRGKMLSMQRTFGRHRGETVWKPPHSCAPFVCFLQGPGSHQEQFCLGYLLHLLFLRHCIIPWEAKISI